ncbi:UvrD-helicase domain-containing protein [uncultured Bifidobacterium sp.]|uniref:UvrD-helicase domain-containing protein n=1 Tax=uncultured Bifidobacterium sp. TaxID=165187 RepID=UPI002635BC8D|nr:UvrD-helicase domain-containing protein [uncultured Bifidobacterium sp.]
MSDKPKFTDSPEQAAVIQAPSYEDVVVVAGAGSGKTYTMTRRIITLIGQGVPAQKILGLTFTRKAASELLSRVSAAVAANRGENAGKTPSGMFHKPEIATYDAFFQGIVRQYGLLVGFDQNTQPLSEAGAMQLIHTVLDRHMDDVMRIEGDAKFSTIASRVFALSNAISGAMIGGDCTDFDEAVRRVRDWDEAFIAQVAKALDGEDVPEDEPKPKKPKNTKKMSDDDREAERNRYRAECHRLCVYKAGQLSAVARERDILLDLVADYHAEKRACNMAEFSDFTIAAFQLVTRFPSIGATYRRRYSHVLLDEYQDTSTTQAALLTALFHVDATRRSAVNAVGDPFQSIYAWRGASPGAFRMLQHDFGMGATDKPYALTVTRRNSRMVLEAANNLTKPLRLPARRRSSSLMREVDVPALANVANAPEGTVGVLAYPTFGQEIDAVVRFAKHAIALHTPSTDDIEHGAKDHRPHVAVLFRSKSKMPRYEDALQRAGLTTLVVGQAALLERPEVRDIFALLHVICDHTDSAALMRLLATPRFAVDSDDLQALAGVAESVNTAYRYRALVSAGIIAPEGSAEGETADSGERHDAEAESGRLDESRIRAMVREYRDQVPNAVFLIDVMLRDDLPKLIENRLSGNGARAVLRAAAMLRQVRQVVGHPLPEAVHAAIGALNLDIDMVLADRMRRMQDGGAADGAHAARREEADDAAPLPVEHATLAKSPLDAVMKLVDTYMQEIATQGMPSLRAFVSWVDSLRDASDDNAAVPDTPVDVVLMTVHQSKGLEWDAVAVVGMEDGTFPSNQGDHLSIKVDEGHLNGMRDGEWVPPEYFETAKTWLSDPAAVPVPVRVDADILPRFPHDAPIGGDPLEALDGLDDAEIIDDEVFGTLRSLPVDDMDGVDPASLYLTQSEEYGRRLHADERRLAYVALTRARSEALLVYSETNEESRDPRALESRRTVRKSKPSNFWQEVFDSMNGIVTAAREPGNLRQDPASGGDAHPDTLHSIGAPLPEGYFVGEHAQDFEDAVVGDAWNAPLEPLSEQRFLPWPCGLTETTSDLLRSAARQVRDALRNMRGDDAGKPFDGEPCDDAKHSDSELPEDKSLLLRARLLADDENLMPSAADAGSRDAFDDAVRAKGERILAMGRQNVTSLQARAGAMSERSAREYWRGLVRPIPRVASPSAQLGTRFHAWAERFVMADADGIESGAYDSRAELVEQLASTQAGSPDERKIAAWQRRLVSSKWASRRPAWAERQLVVDMPELGTIVNGKLDAVFVGGIDAADPTKRYTVVDWKTGGKPRKPEEIKEKLAQLDLYRLLLSTMEGVPLDAIDACLYYLSESKETDRELDALDKTKEEILAELSYGIPQQSDND